MGYCSRKVKALNRHCIEIVGVGVGSIIKIW
jgi:hypothetical protein